MKWVLPCSYGKIAEYYLSYVNKNYGDGITIVFDGYNSGPTTKDTEHERRASKIMAHIEVSKDNIANCPQTTFLSNSNNKAGQYSLQAFGDAECLIVKAAIE